MLKHFRFALVALAVAFVAAFGVRLRLAEPFDLAPGEGSFRRLVAGSTPQGRVHDRALVSLPSLRRSAPAEARIEVGSGAAFRFGVDGGPLVEVRSGREGIAVMAIPSTGSHGARLALAPLLGKGPLVLRRIRVVPAPPPLWASVVAFVGALSAAAFLRVWRGPRWKGAAFLVAFFFGAWVRWYFLPSAGSWDTEYWKAWMHRAVDAGLARVYGDAHAVPPGHFTSQLLGREDRFEIEYKGRSFGVDYPPLAMALWSGSWKTVGFLAPSMDLGERENVAVKLPAVLGDVAAALALILLFRDRPERGLTLAALYWALPVSWLPSAVLGFLDGAYAPLAVLGLAAADRGRAAWSGVLFALAALIKPQALILAPAALVVLPSGRVRAIAAGLAIVAVFLVPFVLAGTLEEAVIHVFRILFQQRLSGGFANVWWIVGHVAHGFDPVEPVQYRTIASVPFRPGLVGTALFSLAAAFILFHARQAGAELAGGALMLAYGTFAVGVHENHPHSMFLAFAATGLFSRRLRLLVSFLSVIYLLNLLSLSRFGRFYGLRYMELEPALARVESLRMALGFDLTLLLAVVNTLLFAWLLFLFASRERFLYSSTRS